MAKAEPEARPDWNPMRDQFTDPKKNAYRNVDLHQQPGYKAMKKMAAAPEDDSITKDLAAAQNEQLFELHVMNVPINMNEVGIQNVFRKYGRILNCFIAKPKPDAQVT